MTNKTPLLKLWQWRLDRMTDEEKEKLEKRKEEKRLYARERRAVNKQHGLCIYCGQEYATPGFVSCLSCRLYRNQMRSGYVKHRKGYMPKGRQEVAQA